MPVTGQTFTYTANNNGSPLGTYSNWTISPGVANTDYQIISGGNNGDSTVAVKWLTANTYSITVTATNPCSTVNPTLSNIVVTAPPVCYNYQVESLVYPTQDLTITWTGCDGSSNSHTIFGTDPSAFYSPTCALENTVFGDGNMNLNIISSCT